MAMESDSAVRGFLRRACLAARQLDDEGSGVLPVSVWPTLLEELGLEDDSEQTYLLMDHLQAAGEGFFTYVPLLQAMHSGPQDAPAPQNGPGSPSAGSNGGRPPPLDEVEEPPFYQRPPASELCEAPGHWSSGPPPSPPPVAFQAEGAWTPPQGRQEPDEDTVSCALLEPEEVNEAFWARRAGAVQRMFHQWDCNQLSNETFAAHIQGVLGDSVDIVHPESEFLRLTNKHRSARTLKFASLVSALRRDAHNTMARRFGRPCVGGSSYASSYAGSYAGVPYAASEAGSEAPSHAAGRATNNAAPPISRGGRRHYPSDFGTMGTSPGSGTVSLSELSSQLPASGYSARLGVLPAPYARCGEDVHGPGQGESAAHRSGPAARQAPPSNFWGLPASAPTARSVSDRLETMSLASGVASLEADSQREVFTLRNRTGHGNILTWGNDSRNITPQKQRTGRQMAMDADQNVPRVHASSGIFPHRR